MAGILGLLLMGIGGGAAAVLGGEWIRRPGSVTPPSLWLALATVIWGACLALAVESLSLLGQLHAPGLVWAWAILDLALIAAAAGMIRRRGGDWRRELNRALPRWRRAGEDWPLDARCALGATVLLAAFAGGVALRLPTTNWDSLTYHLPRVYHWLQQGSVEHFATNNTRQVEFGPWASYAALHGIALLRDDRTANLVQWLALVGSLGVLPGIASALLRRTTHVRPATEARIQALTCLLAATVPIGLVESINPQNDLVTAFWVTCLVRLGQAWLAAPDDPALAGAAGLAAGLGVLTKATAFIYAAPFILGGAVLWWRRAGGGRFRLAAVFAAAFFALNAGHMVRNTAVFGSPLGSPHVMVLERVQHPSLSSLASNVLRNLAMHANTGFEPVSRVCLRALETVHGWTGLDPQDPATTYENTRFDFQLFRHFGVFDSYASAPWHLLALAVAVLALLRRSERHGRFLLYLGALAAGALLFAAMLRWQGWHVRLHLAWLLLAAPATAAAFGLGLPRAFSWLLAAVVFAFSLVCLGVNQSRPIFDADYLFRPRSWQYFDWKMLSGAGPTAQLADALVGSECHDIGLKLRFDTAEHPLRMMLHERGFHGRLRHVFVENETAPRAVGEPEPEALVTTDPEPPEAIRQRYPRLRRFGSWTLLTRS